MLNLVLTFGERNYSIDQLEQILHDRLFLFRLIVEKNLLSFYQRTLLKIGLGHFILIIYPINYAHYS